MAWMRASQISPCNPQIAPLLLTLLLAGLAPALRAESTSQPAAAAELDPPYVDRSFGFTVSPPKGADISRQKKMHGKPENDDPDRPKDEAAAGPTVEDFEVVQFFNEAEQWSLTVQFT